MTRLDRPGPSGASHLDHLERQRRRLAFDVHDGLAQSVCAALLQVEAIQALADSDDLRNEVATLRELLEHALDDIRDLVAELRPAALDADGLTAKIESYVRELEARSDLRIDLAVEGDHQQLSPSAQIAVFRIVQESLTNVRKHARTPSASISLWFEPDTIVCCVADKGIGFDPSAVRVGGREVGHGIPGMKERAELLDGSVDVKSAPGAGTAVTMRIPIWR